MLTPKQEQYVQGLVSGLSQRKAYRKAFPNSKKWKDVTVDNRASELFKNSEVLVRYNELIKKADDKAIMSAIERKIWLTKVIKGEIKDKEPVFHDGDVTIADVETNINTKIKALDTLNKMDGEYIQDIRLSGDKNNPIVTQASVIDSVANQMLEVSEDDIDVGINS